jgi:hypothetical protein
MSTNPQPTAGQRLGDAILVLIVVAVGLAAGGASFTHVKEFTMVNSPQGTGVWFGWANAVITELVPTASALAIRRRRRHNPNAPIGYPIVLMSLAVAASLTAQLAVALPTGFGWFVSALPALAFLGLTRLVLHSSDATHQPTPVPAAASVVSTTPTTPTPIPTTPANPIPVPVPVPVPAPTSTSDTMQVPADPRPAGPAVVATPADMPPRRQSPPRPRPDRPQPVNTDARPSDRRTNRPSTPPASLPASTTDTTTVTASDASQPSLPGMDLAVLAQATRIVREHQRQHGSAITPGQLAVALRINTSEASKILSALANDKPDQPVNGHPVTATP